MKKLTPDQQRFVQADVFGGKLTLRAAEFAGNADQWSTQAAAMGLNKGDVYTNNINRVAELAKLDKMKETMRDTRGFTDQNAVVGRDKFGNMVVNNKDLIETQQVDRTTGNMLNYNGLARMQAKADKGSIELEKAFSTIVKYLPTIADSIEKLFKTRGAKGISDQKDGF